MTSRLSITIDAREEFAMKIMDPIHPGEILMEEFLSPLGLTEKSFAQATRLSEKLISELVAGKTGISAHLALKFSGYFGNTAEFWKNLQSRYELEIEKDRAQV